MLKNPECNVIDPNIEFFHQFELVGSRFENDGIWDFDKSIRPGLICQKGPIENVLNSSEYSSIKVLASGQYDACIQSSVIVYDGQKVGFGFRFKDAANHYQIEFYGDEQQGYISFNKVLNGQVVTLKTIPNTPGKNAFLTNEWYKIVIVMEHWRFQVFWDKEHGAKNPKQSCKDYSGMKQIFDQIDSQFLHGAFALMNGGNKGVCFDDVKICPLNCTQVIKEQENLFVPRTCNRFQENYLTAFDMVWQKQDPKNYKNGPSAWQYTQYEKNQKNLIVQHGLTMSSGSELIPTIIFIQPSLNKLCYEGRFKVDFLAENLHKGFISILFKVKDELNYLSFDIQSLESNILPTRTCLIREQIDGVFKVLYQIQNCEYKQDKWYSVTIKQQGDQIRIKLQQQFKKEEDFGQFKIQLEHLKESGLVGMGSFNTKAYFSDIYFSPNEDFGDISIKSGDDQKLNYIYQAIQSAEVQCSNYTTSNDILKYCRLKNIANIAGQKACENDFCSYCCKQNIDQLDLAQLNSCYKDCKLNQEIGSSSESDDDNNLNDNSETSEDDINQHDVIQENKANQQRFNKIKNDDEQESDQDNKNQDQEIYNQKNQTWEQFEQPLISEDEAWKECAKPTLPRSSFYWYCDKKFQIEQQKSRCYLDACHLCCAMNSLIFSKLQPDNVSYDLCHFACDDEFKYAIKPEIY